MTGITTGCDQHRFSSSDLWLLTSLCQKVSHNLRMLYDYSYSGLCAIPG